MSILKKIYLILLDLVETFVIAGAIFVVVYAFLFRPFQVNGQSMLPNFNNGEYVLTNLITLRTSPIKRGDVIVFKAPPNVEKDYIKRIIGLPGETIILKGGRIYVNNFLLDESLYLPSGRKTNGGQFLRDNESFPIPPHNYFVLGDNREASSDSREWGFVSEDKIIGKSFVVYWPLQEFRIIKEIQYGSSNKTQE